MKLRSVVTLWLAQHRHPVCTPPLPWLLWLNTQRDQLYWQVHVPAHWSLWGAWTHTHPHKFTLRYTPAHGNACTPKKEIYIFNQAALCSLAWFRNHIHILTYKYARTWETDAQMYSMHIHPATCRHVRCYSAIVVIRNDESQKIGAVCEWDSLYCSDEVGVLTTRHLALCASQFVCLSPRGNFEPFIMSVCAPVPSDTSVYPRHVCRACRRVMPGPSHAPPYFSSSFEVLSMEGFITWESLCLSPCAVQ